MICAPAAIERDFRHAYRLGLLRDGFPDSLCGVDVPAVLQFRAAHVADGRSDGHQRLAGMIVDELRVNVLVGAKDAEPRALGRAENALARSESATLELRGFEFVFVCHDLPPEISNLKFEISNLK